MIASVLALGPRKPPRSTTLLRSVAVDSRHTISFESEHEARLWCYELGCSYQQLRSAITAVGPSVDRVCAYLAEQ